MIEYATDVP
jgi:hypothetical protein